MDLMQLYRVAKMYYLDGMNQAEIGKQENLSRSQISRLLEQSRQQGLVRIEVMLPDQIGSDKLESLLARELNLQNLVIVPVDEMDLSEEVINLAIAMGAAPLIANTIRNSAVVGIGWGRTVYQASFHVPFGNYDSETLFVPLVGTSGTNDPHLQINAIIDRFAQKYRGKSFFSGMQVFREREMPLSRLETKRLHNMQHYWNLLDAAIFGLGGRLSDDTFFAEELGEEYAQYIKRSNIVGDVLAQFNADELQKQLDSLQAEFARMQAAAENEMNQLDLSYQQVKAQEAQLESSGAPEYVLELSDIDAWEAWMRIEHTEQIQEVEQRRIKNEIAKLEVKLAESSQIVAPCDGIVTWLSPQAVCGMELLKGTEFMTISDPNKLCVVTERQSDEYRQLCDRIYAVIGNNEYDLTMRERSKDEDMLMKAKGYRFTSTFDFSGDAPESSDAVSNAMVLFVKKYRENVLSVPSETVQEHAGSYYVYTVENGALIQTDVQVGAITALRTEILSGLEEGDVVYVTSY